MSAGPVNGRLPWWYARPFFRLLFKCFLLTIVAVGAAVWVYISPFSSISGLSNSNITTAQLIRERNHVFIVRPESISGSDKGIEDSDAWWRWGMAEGKARCGVVFVLWAGSMGLLIWRYSRRRLKAPPAGP